MIAAIRVAHVYNNIVYSPRKRGCQINQNLNYGFPDFLFFFHILFERITLSVAMLFRLFKLIFNLYFMLPI